MGKTSGKSGIVTFRRYRPIDTIYFDESDFWEPSNKKEIKIVTSIKTQKYLCEKCGQAEIPRSKVVLKHDQEYHLLTSSISGGGTIFCGPVKPENESNN